MGRMKGTGRHPVKRRVVTLWGHKLETSTDEYVLLDVDRTMGDAKRLGLWGQVYVFHLQIKAVHDGCECCIVELDEDDAQQIAARPKFRKGR
jgi:hypothetical protein